MGDVRADIERAAQKALNAAGGDASKVDKGAIVKKFLDKGAARSTLFRWIDKVLGEGLPPLPAVVMPVVQRPAFRVEEGDDTIIGLSEVLGGSSVNVVQQLMVCVTAAQDVMRHARKEDGSVRLPKTLMHASEHLRRTLETAAKLHESMVTLQKLDRYMEAIFAELKEEAPELAQRVLGRLRAVNARYRTDAPDGL